MIKVETLTKKEWEPLAVNAHKVCFNEQICEGFNNIDYAMMVVRDRVPLSYCTVRILDKESCYWQFGGAFPSSKGTIHSFKGYQMYADKCFEDGYKRITTYIENCNVPMLKIALKVGFRIIGTRNFKGAVLVEMLLEKDEESIEAT